MQKGNISTPQIGEILAEEFMQPLSMSASAVASKINVPISVILDILHDKKKITVDTSMKLGKLFGVSSRYFLNLQNDIEARNAEI
ncbi:HigA family addiction module antitoxin [uncultured Lactobacillus sp.]|uniref:HigA family addiction module antitoxin n=1 Tax=uncultured Lactobacillus sp. TaxID=153152 RepID=UPI002805860D|nr:HigA family addiction module antitoxin [uncultured Lactobacillus sp.]